MRILKVTAATGAQQHLALAVKFVALGMAAKVIMVVQYENACVFARLLLVEQCGSQATDSTKASKLQKCRDYLFATLAFPIGQFVGIIFWVLFHIDRELVFPLHYDNFFPNYINHAMHTTVIPAQLLELFLQYHAYPSKRFNGMSTTMIFCFVYLTWTLIVAHFGGVWVIIFLRLNFKRVPKRAFLHRSIPYLKS